MPSRPRKELVDPSQIGVYHCTSRCVRRAFLCGFDKETKRKFDHRKEWIVDRLQLLASITAIEVCDYAIMSNHYHVILRTRPDIARNWSDEDVARRWILLRRSGRDVHFVYTDGIEVDEAEIKMITADQAKVAEYRRRLTSISWFMAQVNEPVTTLTRHPKFDRLRNSAIKSCNTMTDSRLALRPPFGPAIFLHRYANHPNQTPNTLTRKPTTP